MVAADMLETREAFLRAIFDAPDDDTPRLVYADWLDENGEEDFAELIRLQCELAVLKPPSHEAPALDRERDLHTREDELVRQRFGKVSLDPREFPRRGYLACDVIEVSADDLLDPIAFRTRAAVERPEWFGATELRIVAGRIAGGVPVETLFSAPVTQRVTALDLRGLVEEIPAAADPELPSPVSDAAGYEMILWDIRYNPVVTVLGVEALANHRGARRLTDLRLTNNELDNDAARLLVRSPYLTRLRRLELFEGNRLRGRTWQQLLERFGEDVVS